MSQWQRERHSGFGGKRGECWIPKVEKRQVVDSTVSPKGQDLGAGGGGDFEGYLWSWTLYLEALE